MRGRLAAFPCCALVVGFVANAPRAAVVPRYRTDLPTLRIEDPSTRLGTIAETPESLPGFSVEAALWRAFRSEGDAPWTVHLDRRSGAPLLVSGLSKGWVRPGDGVAELEAKIRRYLGSHASLFRIPEAELELNAAASGPIDAFHWLIELDRRKNGVTVEGERVVFYFSAGSLVSFGADRCGAIDVPSTPAVDAAGARARLDAYLKGRVGESSEVAPPGLVYAAEPAGPEDATSSRAYVGAVGGGLRYRLVWRLARRFDDEQGTWVGKIDALSGEVVAFFDENAYAQAKGGVYPLSDDQLCPDGCEQPGWPMPYADITTSSGSATAGSIGSFACSPAGGPATTQLAGPYVRVADQCGPVSETVTCDNDLDLASSPGTDCDVPPGRGAGDTHASRSGFYHLNRVMEKGRAWLPANVWLQSQLVDNVNINQTCNAYWNGASVNFFKSGGGCRNTGEIAGVFVHEWGHGLDENDGGGYDNPSEAYADVVAMLDSHQSCVGRGFYESQNCTGYGDACLNCTGIRDHDFDRHVSHAPVTPAGFVAAQCPAGSGPCGKEVHCEGYVAAEAMWDLANRDLPAQGLDAASAWQTADRLFFTSRQGSGGNAYNCALPSSDGCAATSWFNELRTLDDDDGNLANGTPHAAAIFAAFARHGIACGAAGDLSNQNQTSCLALAAPALTVGASSGTANLTWTAVSGAAGYLVLRNDAACQAGHTIIGTVAAPANAYTDTGLADGFEEHYAVQARAANAACLGPVSNCVAVAPQPTAGTIRLDRAVYDCGSTLQVTVADSNVGASSVAAHLVSEAEPAGEDLTLVETFPGSARFVASLLLSPLPAAPGDGLLSVAHGVTITARYTDANDGQGGTNILRQTTASVDCVPPAITGVSTGGITDTAATVHWTTNEAADSRVTFGPAKPPGASTGLAAMVTAHDLDLAGLTPCTKYFYSVGSQDAGGNLATDSAGGAYYEFQTLPAPGAACHLGAVTLDRGLYSCNDFVTVTVADIDLDRNPAAVETAVVTVSSTSEAAPEQVVLTETAPDSGIFTGSVATGALPVVAGDGIVEAKNLDTITATYRDQDNGLGSPAVVAADASLDCAPPIVSQVSVTAISDDTSLVSWTTSEEAYGYVEFGPTPSFGNTAYESFGSPLQHSVEVSPVYECERTYFRIVTTDDFGYTAIADNAGAGFNFNAWRIPGAIYKQDFEGNHGWTLQGDWQVAAPQGLGSDAPDPTAAEHGTKVLGVDLTGLGAHPGDYEEGATWTATSPTINASQLRNAVLKFRMWLNTDPDATAKVQVFDENTWIDVFSTSAYGWYDAQWETVSFNVSDNVDGNDAVQIRFSQYGGPPGTMPESGWNVDRVELRDGSITTPVACGGCTGAPSFGGLVSTMDADGCAPSGVLLSWEPASAWGTGTSGTYTIYRDPSATFLPSAANRIAQGIGGAAYLDTTAPIGTTFFYVVRAETDETCSTGSHNGGVTDVNLVRRSARDDASQPSPGSVGNTLRLALVNGATVRLSWSAAQNAATYDVLRSGSPSGSFGIVGQSSSLALDDLDRGTIAASDFYLIRAADSCGHEGP